MKAFFLNIDGHNVFSREAITTEHDLLIQEKEISLVEYVVKKFKNSIDALH